MNAECERNRAEKASELTVNTLQAHDERTENGKI